MALAAARHTPRRASWPVSGGSRRRLVPEVTVRATASAASGDRTYSRLAGVSVLRAADGTRLPLVDAWARDERALLVLARSFGCPFCQATARELARDCLPSLTASGVRLVFVGIGTAERARDFAARTALPLGVLYADPDNAAYDALGLEASFASAFLSPQTPLAIARRAAAAGGWPDLKAALDGWQPWQPPKGVRQALNQGGAFLFDGRRCVWSHRDPATAAHAEPSEMLSRALALAREAGGAGGGGDCGCAPAEAPAAST